MLNLAEMELDNLTYAHAHFKTINNNAQTQSQQRFFLKEKQKNGEIA